jgi:hypothetical protein
MMNRVRNAVAWLWTYVWTALWMMAVIGLGLLVAAAPRELKGRELRRAYVLFCRRVLP